MFKLRHVENPEFFTFVEEICVTDPETKLPVHVEIWRDNNSGGMFGIDSSFLEQVGKHYNPFSGEEQDLPEPE
jgi:hypothetical protein